MAYSMKKPPEKVIQQLKDQENSIGPLSASVAQAYDFVLTEEGTPCLTKKAANDNRYTCIIGSRECKNIIREIASNENAFFPSKATIQGVEEQLTAIAEGLCNRIQVAQRIGQLPNGAGIVINRGDQQNTRFCLINGKVHITHHGNDSFMTLSGNTKPLPLPALDETANWKKTGQFLNMDQEYKFLIISWMMFVMVTPPREGLSYPILILQGSQSTGKTFLSRMLRALIDPHQAPVSKFPASEEDLAIQCEQKYLQIFDNLREVKAKMSDQLCMIATGAADERRELYTNSGLVANRMHNPVVLNGIHQISDQQDFASRCLYIQMLRLTEEQLAIGYTLHAQLEQDLPAIYGGLLKLAAQALKVLPSVQLKKSGRMIDFTRFIAAVEVVLNIEEGSIQHLYMENQRSATMGLVEQDELTMLFYKLAQSVGEQGITLKPADLHTRIQAMATLKQRSKNKLIPVNAASLGKKIDALSTPLNNVGVDLYRVGSKRDIYIGMKQKAESK